MKKIKSEILVEYIVKFEIDCISKKGMISRKSGEVDLTTDASVTELYEDEPTNQCLKELIAKEMEIKTKKSVFNVDLIDII